VDYGQIIKTYGTEESIEAQRRYSAPKIASIEKKAIYGRPDLETSTLCGLREMVDDVRALLDAAGAALPGRLGASQRRSETKVRQASEK